MCKSIEIFLFCRSQYTVYMLLGQYEERQKEIEFTRRKFFLLTLLNI